MTITPPPATKNAARGLHCVAISPPRTKPMPGVAEAADSSVPMTLACIRAAVSSCTALITATHWTPLPSPPTAEAPQAIASPGAAAMPR